MMALVIYFTLDRQIDKGLKLILISNLYKNFIMFQKDESGEDDIVDLKLNGQPPNSGALSTQGDNK